MPCNNCGGALEIVEQSGGIDGGPFYEEYECVSCGETGSVSGESSDPPSRWRKEGQVFSETRP